MVLTPQFLRLVKSGFLLLLVVSLSIAVSLLYFAERREDAYKAEDDLPYIKRELEFSQDMLHENFDSCLFAPMPFLKELNKNLITNFTRYDYLQFNKQQKERWFPLVDLLVDFGTLMLSYLRIETVLIEPSLLFCMLSSSRKALLIKRKFNLRQFLRPEKVLTLGIRGEDTVSLQRRTVVKKIESLGFEVVFLKEPVAEWMKNESTHQGSFTSHIFFSRREWTIHLVVLHSRGGFLWHAPIRHSSSVNIPPKTKLFFAKTESAYDNFTFTSLGIWGEPLNFINIPSNPQYFLFEIDSSKFIECNSTIVSDFLASQAESTPKTHASLSVDRFNRRAAVALQELKVLLNPFLLHFWIWSGTMLGWHRQCDIIPYTTDVDFGAWASEVDDLTALVAVLSKNDHINLQQLMGKVDTGLEFFLSCHSLRVDIFFLYEESNGTWYAGHRPSKGYYFKYHHPHFSLCSASLMGHKVLVPCQTESVIAAEYGSEWMHPVSSWNYESSIKNRGPNIYWNKSELKTVYPD